MVAERIEVTSPGRLFGEITSRGQLVDPAGKRLAGFTQRVQMTLGARLVVVEIELEPAAPLAGDPWQSYFASRFAWADGSVELRRDVHLMSRPTTAGRIEAANFIEIEAGGGRTAILPGGLPYHCRMGPRMLDTLLIVRGETARRFRLGIGIDLPHPWTAALDMLGPPPVQAETAAAPSPARHGWLFHIDARNVAATHWEPLLAEGAEKIVGFSVRLLETEGRAGRVKLNCFRAPDSTTRTNFLGQPSGELTIEQGRIVLEMGAFEWAQIEAMRWNTWNRPKHCLVPLHASVAVLATAAIAGFRAGYSARCRKPRYTEVGSALAPPYNRYDRQDSLRFALRRGRKLQTSGAILDFRFWILDFPRGTLHRACPESKITNPKSKHGSPAMRKAFIVAAFVLIASAGCHMGATPYDYCSPVVESYNSPDGGGSWSDSDSDVAHRNMPQRAASAQQPQQQPQGPALAGYNGGQ